MEAVISIISVSVGVVLGFMLTYFMQKMNENKKKKELAGFFRAEIELNVLLIRLFGNNLGGFQGRCAKILVRDIQPFKVYNSYSFDKLPTLGFELSTEIKAFYLLTKLKFKSLENYEFDNHPKAIEALGNLEEYLRIDKDWDKGWQDLEKKGNEILRKLRKI